jgi:predicted 3-demethylubiquinone-9 3-methyltransferase (glyoxalase superfamily)
MGNFNYKEQYGIVVICQNEEEQKAIYERLLKEGFKLKVVTV